MKHLLIFLWCSLMAMAAWPQSREVFFEDFEMGTFETSEWPNWTLQQDTDGDYWMVGPCADKVSPPLNNAGNNVAYITKKDGNGENTYGGAYLNGRQAHFYRDVHISADSVYVLTFDWKSKGYSSTCLKISGSDTSYTPSGAIGSSYQIGPNFVGTGEEWQFASITFTHTETKDRRLFFTWYGESQALYAPPPAVDNIRLTAYPKETVGHVEDVQAGQLKNASGIKEVTNLIVAGSLDASDFAFMRDSMPVLRKLDISGATIAEIPENAFYNGLTGKTTLDTVVFPTTAYAIGASAFRKCTGLTGSMDLSKATAIGRDAFRECTGLTGALNLAAATSIGNAAFFFASSSAPGKFNGVTLSDDLTVIGDSAFSYAFYNATGDLTVPASVTSIGEKAFAYYAYNKNEAHQLIFATSSELTTIGANAFYNLLYFSGNLVIPASVTSIGDYAFSSYGSSSSNTELSLSFAQSSQLTAIGSNAFASCSKFTGDLALPAGVTSIGNSAFSGCSGLNGALTLPSALKSIGDRAFYNCSGLQFAPVTIPSEMTKIANNTFYGCSKLTSVILHDGITEIGSNALYGTGITAIDLKKVTTVGSAAFQNCAALTSIHIPDGVTIIENSTFNGCTSLATVTLPSSLTAISSAAFKSCTALDSITVFAKTPPTLNGTNTNTPFNGITLSDVELKVPTSSTSAYEEAATWTDFNIVGNGYSVSASSNDNALGVVEGIANRFYPAGIINLTATPKAGVFINWTGGGTEIGAAPVLALNVQSDTVVTANFGIVLNHTLAAAGTLNEVQNIKNYTRITLTGNINAKDIACMRDSLPKLKELFLSGATIEAYNGTEGTREGAQVYPANTLPQDAFNGTTGKALIALTLPNNLTAIGENALRECSKISNALTIPQGVTSIGAAAFYNCSRLTGNLTLPAGLTAIADNTFYGCSGFRGNLKIPTGVTAVGARAFQLCSGLTALSLPQKLTSIGDHAFMECSGLTSVSAHNPVPVPVAYLDGVWYGLNHASCILHVASSSVEAYKSVPGWSIFKNIQGAGFSVKAEPNGALLGTVTGGENKFYLKNETVELTATPATGFTFVNWTSKGDTLSTNMAFSLTVTQDTVVVANFVSEYRGTATAGQLHKVPGIAQKSKLTLDAASTLNARDFAFMRDGMPYLVDLNIDSASIVEYTGTDGTVDGNMTYEANKIPQESFNGKLLVSVKLPAGTTLIGESAFRNTAALTGIEIPAGVTDIENYAFSGSGIARVTFAENAQLTTIGDYAFSGCTELAGSLTVPAKVSAIGTYAFAKDDALNSSNKLTAVTFPAKLRTIGANAFRYNKLLESIEIAEGLRIIGESAFEGCSRLKGKLQIPFSMAAVAARTFAGDSLQYLFLHEDITKLGHYAFANNPFDSVRVDNPTPLVLNAQNLNPFHGVNSGSVKRPLLVPEGSYSAYLKAAVWGEFQFGSDVLMSEYRIDYGNRDWRIETAVNDTAWGSVEDISAERGMPDWIRMANDYEQDEYYYATGQTARLKATPSEGYHFVNWTTEGSLTQVSNDAEYAFPVTGKLKLIAHFASETGLNTINVRDVQVYPNPVKGVLTVEYGSLNPGDKLSVYDISGVFVAAYEATGTKTALDVTRLASGSYLLKAGATVLKFVVIR
jgi:hypothetical protein